MDILAIPFVINSGLILIVFLYKRVSSHDYAGAKRVRKCAEMTAYFHSFLIVLVSLCMKLATLSGDAVNYTIRVRRSIAAPSV